MTRKQFTDWLSKLKNAWEKRDPNAAPELCADKFIWHETPFEKPITTKKKLLEEWQSVLRHKDISMTYEVISLEKDFGIAHWTASFTRIPSGKKVHLDGIFKVSLDANGNCTEFHQWYNTKNE